MLFNFNRTKLELKGEKEFLGAVRYTDFNRTKLELKVFKTVGNAAKALILIAPNWN